VTRSDSKKNVRVEKMLHAGILEKFWDLELKDFKGDKKALEISLKYVDKFDEMFEEGIGLYYLGNTGVGKTYLMIGVMKEILFQRKKYSVQFASLSGIVDVFAGSWWSEVEKRKWHKQIRNVHLLGIDDIGKEFRGRSGLTEAVFDNLLRYRVYRKLPTLFTSNKEPIEIKSNYGESVVSLLAGCIYGVKVRGSDFRKTVEQKRVKDILFKEDSD